MIGSPMRRYQSYLPLLLLLAIFTAIILIEANAQRVATVVDFWYYQHQARALSPTRLETWVNPYYGVGYFALLRIGLSAGFDMVSYSQLISWLGAILCLTAVYLITCHVTRRVPFALAAIGLLALHPFFRFQTLQEGTDMLAAGLQLMAVTILFIDSAKSLRETRNASIVAGALLGGAYLIRYTTLVFLPVLAFYLCLRDWKGGGRLANSLSFLLVAFIIVSLPQILASTIVKGNPFYNEQMKNIWFGVHGDFNWTDNWGKIPPDVSLVKIVQEDPAGFLGHWGSEIGRFFAYDANVYATDPLGLERKVSLWDPFINHLLWLAASVALLVDRRLTRPQAVLLLTALFFPVVATSIAWLFTRYLLVPLAIQVIVVVLAASQFAERAVSTERTAIGIGLLLIGLFSALFMLSTNWGVKQARTREIVQRIKDAQPLLASMGVTRSDQLMTNNRLYQILDDPNHPQYALFQQPNNQPSDVSGLLQQIMGVSQPDILLFDWTSHAIRTISIKPYREKLIAAKDRLAPLELTDDYALYCIVPCQVEDAHPVEVALSPELSLVGYRAFSGESVHGLYLFWSISAPVVGSQQISVTVRDEDGGVLFHKAGDSQSGTFPINQWPADVTIVDFYLISSDAIGPNQTFNLTVDLFEQGPAESRNVIGSLTIPVRFSPTP